MAAPKEFDEITRGGAILEMPHNESERAPISEQFIQQIKPSKTPIKSRKLSPIVKKLPLHKLDKGLESETKVTIGAHSSTPFMLKSQRKGGGSTQRSGRNSGGYGSQRSQNQQDDDSVYHKISDREHAAYVSQK